MDTKVKCSNCGREMSFTDAEIAGDLAWCSDECRDVLLPYTCDHCGAQLTDAEAVIGFGGVSCESCQNAAGGHR